MSPEMIELGRLVGGQWWYSISSLGAVVVTKHLPGAVVVVNLSPVGQWW